MFKRKEICKEKGKDCVEYVEENMKLREKKRRQTRCKDLVDAGAN